MNKTSLLELAKKLNVPRRKCIKTKEGLQEAIKDTITGYKEIIFGSNTPACMACLDEIRKQQVNDQKIHYQKLMDDTVRKLAWELLQKNIVMDGDIIQIEEQVKPWILELILDIGKTRFKPILQPLYIDHKITCRKVEELHILNGTNTLGT